MFSKKSVTRGLLAASAVALLAAGCDSGSVSTTTGTAPGGGAIDSAKALTDAQAVTATAFKGTSGPVDTTSRAAVKGKKLAIVASGLAASSSKIPALAAEEAAKAAGWDVSVYDAGLNPARYPELVRQATAAGADGIIIVTFDCKDVKQPLEEAKAKGIAITSIYGFDCNDSRTGNVSDPLFTATTNYGTKAPDIVEFTKKYGADQASYIIADSNNEAKIIEIVAPEFTILNHTSDGFRERIEQSGGSEIVSTLEITQSDIASGKLAGKVENELLKHPDATWIKSPFTYVTTLGVGPALKPGSTLKVMGGEGFVEEIDLMREGKVSAVNSISSEWSGWAAVDVLNSVWRKEKPADSGIGWTIIDKDHGMPAEGPIDPKIDFRGAYRKAWGV